LDPEESCEVLIQEIVNLMRRMSIPYRLKDLGIPYEDIPVLAKSMIKNTRLLDNNPRQISEGEAVKIFSRMWKGKLS
jgi:alcohol dehydrogenase class IV